MMVSIAVLFMVVGFIAAVAYATAGLMFSRKWGTIVASIATVAFVLAAATAGGGFVTVIAAILAAISAFMILAAVAAGEN